MPRYWQAAVVFGIVLALAFPGRAEAHSELVAAEPPPGATLQQAPKMIELRFSEALEPMFSKVLLVNAQGQLINAGPGIVDAAAPTNLHLELQELPLGSYAAIYTVRSAIDGSISRGSVPFGIGRPSSAATLIPPPGTPEPMTAPIPKLEALARWFTLLATTIALGGIPFGLFVWRPAYYAAQQYLSDLEELDQFMARSIRRVLVGGLALLLLANLFLVVVQAADAATVSLLLGFGAPIVQLFQGRSGVLILARAALTLLLVLLSWRLPSTGHGVLHWWLSLLVGGALAATFSLTGHSAAVSSDRTVAILFDWMHFAATAVLVGSLLPLLIAIRAIRRATKYSMLLELLIRQFARLMVIGILFLTLSGNFSYILHIESLDLALATTYGRALLVKTGVFAFVVIIGGLELWHLYVRLAVHGNRLARPLEHRAWIGLFSAAFLLLAASAMMSVVPSKVAVDVEQRLGSVQEATIANQKIVLRVAPTQVGDNEFVVDVADTRLGAQDAQTQVMLNFAMPGMEMGTLQTQARQIDTTRYRARGNLISMGGRWQIEVVLHRPGFADLRHTFEFYIARGTS